MLSTPRGPSATVIDVSAMRKEFGPTVAVADVTFQVKRGEIVGLLGPNGSGKTTLMRMISGFFPPTSGRAMVAGIDIQSDSFEVRRHIGYLPENVALYPDLPVQRYLGFCAELKGVPRNARAARVEAAISDAGLAEVRGKQIRKLSKGFRQRVGIAQALVHAPEVVILDEPTVGLDPNHVVEIRELIRQLRHRSTILFSTHILSEAASLCDRVIILHQGRILADDTAEGMQARLEGAIRTLFGVRGPESEVIHLLKQLPGVERIENCSTADDGSVRALVVSRSEDVRHEAVLKILERGWTVVEVSPKQWTLEDLFMRLVKQSESGN